MYEEQFGLTARPFQLTPDPKFWFETVAHRKAMAYLGYGLRQGEGFIVITGDVGAGKTTLVGHVVERIDSARLNVVRLVSTQVEAEDLLRIVAAGFGLDPAGKSKAELLAAIERGLNAVARTGRHTLLIVDEAQALPIESLEELRMLSNFQAGGHALLQIFLLGQPEFRDRLNGAEALEQLRQRVIATHHLDPMGAEEVEGYVAHRLTVAGWAGTPDFAVDAFDALHHASGGVPRRLNQLAERVMLHCALEGVTMIDAGVVESVAADHAPAARISAAESPAQSVEEAVEQLAPEIEEAVEPIAVEPLQVEEAHVEEPQIEPTVAEDAEPLVAVEAEPVALEAEPERDPSIAEAEVEPEITSADDVPATGDEEAEERHTVTSIGLSAPRHLNAADYGAPLSFAADEAAEPLPMTDATALDAPRPIRLISAEPIAAAPGLADERLMALEARVDEQDRALRRVLTLMVDWVEHDTAHAAPPLRDVA